MEIFSGTLDGFIKYVGPRVRNVVQNSLAKKLRKKIGKCQYCGSTNNLHAAHIHGFDRILLIIEALGDSLKGKIITSVDLDEFEKRFCKLHSNPEEIFLILCRKCHKIYDSKTSESEINNGIISSTEIKNQLTNTYDFNSVLPIKLFPSDVDEFKRQFLLYKKAIITILYNDGSREEKIWKVSRFSETSNVIGNLRSRPEFRQSNWQDANIKGIQVKIII